MLLSPHEKNLWDKDKSENGQKSDDREINERYLRREGRIVIETNREKLPGFVAALSDPKYMDLRPFYQRRPRWDSKKQSLLIESFIMNIPVPPVFLYEKEYNSYEVMDGQQRITAIKDFYSNAFELTGLQMWPELNGRTYKNLPDKLRAGVDRRSITSIVLLKESTADEEEASLLRETVFERLNTGGVELERQEIRNALYQSQFNDLLKSISQEDRFRKIWGIPRYVENEIESNKDLLNIPFFSKMKDMETVLRFFALRHVSHYKRGMQGFLDLYMMRSIKFDDSDIDMLRDLFDKTFTLALDIYGELAFRVFEPEKQAWEAKAHTAFYDAVMVGLASLLAHADVFRAEREKVVEKTKELFIKYPKGTFTGRGNSKKDVEDRISFFSSMLRSILEK